MSRTADLYEKLEDLVFQAIEKGANNTNEVMGYVTQYIPKSMVSYNLIENIIEEAYGEEEDYQEIPTYH